MKVDSIAKLRVTILQKELSLKNEQVNKVLQFEISRLLVFDSLQKYGRSISIDDRKRMITNAMNNYREALRKTLNQRQWDQFQKTDSIRYALAEDERKKMQVKVSQLDLTQ